MWQDDAHFVKRFNYLVHCFACNISHDSCCALEESRLHVLHSTEPFSSAWDASGAVVADYEGHRADRMGEWCAAHPGFEPEHQHAFYHSAQTGDSYVA